MISFFKIKLIRIAEILHLRIFGHEMGEEMRTFLGHLSWSFLGIFFSSAILFFGSVLIGRFLGPNEFGKYNLVLAISNVAIVFMFFGFDTTAVKFISSGSNEIEKKAIIKNVPTPPTELPITYADISKAQKMLGYEPKVKIEEGMKRFVEWYQENKHLHQ